MRPALPCRDPDQTPRWRRVPPQRIPAHRFWMLRLAVKVTGLVKPGMLLPALVAPYRIGPSRPALSKYPAPYGSWSDVASELHKTQPVPMATSLQSIRLNPYDENQRKMVSFSSLKGESPSSWPKQWRNSCQNSRT